MKETEKKREEVSQFAQSLVLEAMKIPNVDSSNSFASDGATLNIGFKNHSEPGRCMFHLCIRDFHS